MLLCFFASLLLCNFATPCYSAAEIKAMHPSSNAAFYFAPIFFSFLLLMHRLLSHGLTLLNISAHVAHLP